MKLPSHVAIIMDGNGRWAKACGVSRNKGHSTGLEVARTTVKYVAQKGIPYVTLYVFSTENWKRTADEVGFLMGLVKKHLHSELTFYQQNKIRVKHIGDIAGLPKDVATEIVRVESETAHFLNTTVLLAINYGGRNEILRAAKKLSIQIDNNFCEEALEKNLDTNSIPPVDLLIRTGGEKRLSNFLLWQAAYAELYFCDTLWPDWTEKDFDLALKEYQSRNRRFGGRK